MKKDLPNSDSDPLTCDPALFPGKNRTNIAKSNPTLLGKGKRDKAMILTCLNSSMSEVFRTTYFFSISAIFRWRRGAKFEPKVPTFGPSLFYKIFLVRILATLDHIWGSKGLKTSTKGPFRGC